MTRRRSVFVTPFLFRSAASFSLAVTLLALLCVAAPKQVFAQQSGTSTWQVVPTITGMTTGEAYGVGDGGASITPSNGAIATTVSSNAGCGLLNGSGHGNVSTSGGRFVYTLNWKPKNNDFFVDPTPPVAVVYYRARVKAYADANGGYIGENPPGTSGGTGQASANCLDATASASASVSAPPRGSATDGGNWVYSSWYETTLYPSSGTNSVEIVFQLSSDSTGYCYNWTRPADGGGSSYATAEVEFYVAGLDMGRHNGILNSILDGSNSQSNFDPSFTRWLPLSFSPIVSNAPFKGVDGNLTPIWGNIHCNYSIGIYREPNPDHNGTGNFYTPPALGSPIIKRNSQNVAPGYVLLDANGDRLTFDANFTPASDIKSTFVASQSGFTLSNAGPPGRLRERGPYTYKFAPFPSSQQNNPQPARLQSIEDAFGNKQTCTYPGSGNYLVVTDLTSGRQLLFNTFGGYVTEVIAPYAGTTTPFVRTTLGRDGSGHMTSLSVYSGSGGPAVQQTTYQYENDSPILVQRGSLVQQMAYILSPSLDVFGQPIRRLSLSQFGSTSDSTSDSPVGRSTSFTYGTITQGYGYYGIDSRTNKITDPLGNVTEVVYHYADPQNGSFNGAIKAVDVKAPTYTGATGTNLTKSRYTPDMTRYTSSDVQDALGRTWAATYHATSGAMTQFRDPVNNIWTMDWGVEGTTLLSATDPTNVTWNFQYTPNGKRLTRVTDPAGRIQSELTYNPYGQLDTVSVPAATSVTGLAETATFTYDNTTGDLMRVSDGTSTVLVGAFNLTTRTIQPNSAYDPLGDPLAFSVFPDTGDPATTQYPLTTLVEYNAAQAPVKITGPNGMTLNTVLQNGIISSLNAKDPASNLLWQASFARDTRGRLYSLTDLAGSSLQLRYDGNSNIKQYWDGRGGKTYFNYGPNGELTSQQWPDGATASVLYNAAGQARQTTDERGIVFDYGYDTVGRFSTLTVPSDTMLNRSYTYDNAGRVLSITSANGDSITFGYNSTDKRVSSITTTHQGFTYSISYTYGGDGCLTGMTSPIGTTTYGYNSDKNMTTLTSPYGHVTTWTFDKLRRITSQTSTGPGGANVSTYYDYGNTGQTGDTATGPVYLKALRHKISVSQWLWSHYLTRSYLGQILQSVGSPGNGGPISTTDNEYNTYGYDNRGRLTAHQKTYTSGGSTTSVSDTFEFDLANNLEGGTGGWSYNASNQVTSAPVRPLIEGATGLTYDVAGNMTGLGNFTYTWDKFGQMATATRSGTPALTVAYTYDLFGRRATKRVNGTLTTRYLYDGQLLIGETDAAGTITRSYTWGQLGLIGNRINSVNRFYLFDPQGNTEYVIQSNNTILWSHGRYSTFGTQLAANTVLNNGWKGQFGAYADSDTGLIRMGARDYSPKIGRFITRDPSGYSGGPNLYAYCGGDPINMADVNGEFWHFVGGFLIGGSMDAGFPPSWHGATARVPTRYGGRRAGALSGAASRA